MSDSVSPSNNGGIVANRNSENPAGPIAVVGVSALFPGSLDVTGFWRDILAAQDLMSDVPPDHWLVEDYYGEQGTPDKIYTKRGAFLNEVDFDPMHWGMPPGNLSSTDTAQLLALIVAQKVLEDAAGSPEFEGVDRDRVSVILGVASATELVGQMASRIQRPVWQRALRESGLPESQVQEACDRIANSYADWNESTFPGVLGNVVAGRIANRLNLGGTNCVIDAACASSLAGTSMAIQELQLGTSDLVITGGVDALNDPFMYMCFSQTPALSPTGDCRPFSDEADGTMLGEGLGMVALKRLPDAERDGDRIYAVLRGLGSSSDGKSKSVYAPVSSGQAKALRRAYERAGYSADTVELVEAHGTATKAGDAAEIGGLREVFEATEAYENGAKQWCALGSVKSQIGHTKAAAGSASLIKVVLALHHKVLPPTLKVQRPSPALDIENSPFYLSTERRPWIRPDDHPRRASVSSFGFGGSNFHAALEEYIGTAPRANRLRTQPAEMFLYSGDSPEAVFESLSRAVTGAADREGFLYQSFESLNRFDAGLPLRLAIVAADGADLKTKAELARKTIQADPQRVVDLAPGVYYANDGADSRATTAGSADGVAFLFPGQGSQYVGMGGDLLWNFDGARAVWDRVASSDDQALSELRHAVYARPVFDDEARAKQHARLTATHRAQPAIGLVSLAMLEVLKELGVAGEYFGGHSFGELTALHAAGAYSVDDFLATARKRGELMDAAAETAEAPGAMTAVFHDIDSVEAIVRESRHGVVLANLNTPDQVVLAGSVTGIESIEAQLIERGIENKRLPVATAFHSEYVSPSSAPFAEFLGRIAFQTPSGKVYSNVNAGPYQNGSSEPEGIRARLAEQIARPVRFFEQIEAMYAAGARTFIEVGPSSVLTRLTAEILAGRPHVAVSLDQKNQPGMQSLFHAVAKLSALAGLQFDLSALWKNYAVPVDPATRAKPKLTVKINGSNYGKPYPPEGGAAALPKPNPERPAASVATNPGATNGSNPTAVVRSAEAANGNGAASAPSVTAVQPDAGSVSLPAPATASPSPAFPAAGAPADPGYLDALQAMQRQTAEAHAAYQRALGESHQSYLRVAETAFQNLNAALGAGQGATPSQPAVPSMPAANFAPAPVAPAVASPGMDRSSVADYQSNGTEGPASPKAGPAPSPSPSPSPQAAPGLSIEKLEALMMATVAEKTGYPEEMLELDMELEAGLGIDSIKRVQILAAVKQQAPEIGEVDAKHLGTLRTLREIVDYLKTNLSATPDVPASGSPAASAPAIPAVDLEGLMMATVAEKTGYPVEMLELDMELEAGLGIDSIKRVQILAAVKQQAPEIGEVDAKHLGTLRTLREIVDYMRTVSPASIPASGDSTATAAPEISGGGVAGADFAALEDLMLRTVAEKTGYPVEMLEPDMELEAGLGIDSIKRVQILAAVKQARPDLPEMDPKHLGTLRTLREIIDYMRGANGASVMPAGATASSVHAAPPQSAASSYNITPAAGTTTPAVGRFALRAVPAPAPGFGLAGLQSARRIAVSEDGRGIATELVRVLIEAGYPAEVATEIPENADAVISLAGLRATPDEDAAIAINREVFAQARAVAARFGESESADISGIFVTVQDLGGDFGLASIGQNLDAIAAYGGGIAGLTKTAAQEWPAASVKAIDVAGQGRSIAEIARAVFEELVGGGLEREVGLLAEGSRIALESYPEEIVPATNATNDAGDVELSEFVNANSVIVATGGARGVTAHTLVALARQHRPRCALLGRTPLSDEPEILRAITDDAGLKRALLAAAKERGEKITPADLNHEAGRIQANREVRRTLELLRAAGSEARYFACDVNDEAQLAETLADVRTQWGPITGILHGAGVLADKLIAEKTPEQFDRVFNTKVEGLRALLKATEQDPLSYLCLFSSVAARAGNVGQCDYAMANEVLNKVAAVEAQRRGSNCFVRSMNWGPWEGGMVTPELKQQFESMGVPLIDLDTGARMLVDELRAPPTPSVEVVFGGSPTLSIRTEPVKYRGDISIDPVRYAFLKDHAVRGTPVVPLVWIVEWAARAARSLRPGGVFAGCQDLRMLRGIRLENPEDILSLRLELSETQTAGVFDCLLVGAGEGGVPHYRCRVETVARADYETPVVSRASFEMPQPGSWPFASDAAYAQHLFHGPAFQVIEELETFSPDGATARLASGREFESDHNNARLTDSGVLDGALQIALLWTAQVLGGENLPTGLDAFIPHTPIPPETSVRCILSGRADDARLGTRSDILLVDANDAVLAELRGVEMHRV